MGRKNIRLTEEAYRALVRSRRPGESFCETINRLAHGRDLMRFAGSISQEFAEQLLKSSRETRERFDREMRRRDRRHGFTGHDDR